MKSLNCVNATNRIHFRNIMRLAQQGLPLLLIYIETFQLHQKCKMQCFSPSIPRMKAAL